MVAFVSGQSGGKLVIAVVVLMVVPIQHSEMQTGAVCS